MRLHEGTVTANGIRMHYAEAGEGPLVILLHGFPEFWYSWRYQLPALAQAGFRAVAPDLRGYGETEKPRGVQAYAIPELLKDIDGLRAALGAERAFVVGHDWGGALAWAYAAAYPERVERVAVLNAPHPAAYADVLKRSWRQRLMSWYILFFQIPWLPEALMRWSGYAPIRAQLTRTVRPEAMAPADIDRYMANLRQPGMLTAGMNYYRALVRAGAGAAQVFSQVRAPALVLWGEEDPYLVRANAEAVRPYVHDLQVTYLPGAGHGVQLDAPEAVGEALIRFFQGAKNGGGV